MAKKSLGYVELQWTCPNCGTKNPGSQRICQNCGAPQPDDIEFEQPAEEKLIEDEAKLAQAKAGPDIHCYYCGTRNPATASHCSQCGADLSEGAKRRYGQIVGAHRDKPAQPVICPNCGTPNDPDAPTCTSCGAALAQPEPQQVKVAEKAPRPGRSKAGLFGGIGLAVIALICAAACVVYFVLANRTEAVTGTVSGVNWTRTIAIQGLRPVEHEDWFDRLPAGAAVGACRQEVRRVQDSPAPNSREICGTPYTVDTGSGFGQVVQECRYEVLERFCEYTVEEWRQVDEITFSGDDFSPQWPQLNLGFNEREGERGETYQCIFTTEGDTYTYTTSNPNDFTRCEIGSRWVLEVNTFGVVNEITPVR